MLNGTGSWPSEAMAVPSRTHATRDGSKPNTPRSSQIPRTAATSIASGDALASASSAVVTSAMGSKLTAAPRLWHDRQGGGGGADAHRDGPELVVVGRRRQHMHDAGAGTGTGVERVYPAPLIDCQPGDAVAAGLQALPRPPRHGPRQGIHLQDPVTDRRDQHAARRMKGCGARGLAQPVDDHELGARCRVDDRELAVAAHRIAGVHDVQQAVVSDGEKASVRPG